MKYKIAVVGATGVVGSRVLKLLVEKNLQNNKYSFYAEEVGKTIKFGKKQVCVKKLDEKIFEQNFDFAIFCTTDDISKKFVKKLSKKGVVVIDFSATYRKDYPLIVPEINGYMACGNIICNPNCSTIAGVMALYKIHKKFGLKRVVYSTYQAVSGAGKLALDDLKTKDKTKLKKLDFVINNNLIPYIGNIDEKGYTTEENKMIFETKKILDDSSIKVTATCVRVPVDICHSESINFETKKPATKKEILQLLKTTKGVKVVDDYPNYPMPIFTKNQQYVLVGRIRKDYSQKNTFNIFICSDNLLKGSAQNAVQILELLLGGRNDI